MQEKDRFCPGSEFTSLRATREGHWYTLKEDDPYRPNITYCRPCVRGMQIDPERLRVVPHSAGGDLRLNCDAARRYPLQAGWIPIPGWEDFSGGRGVAVVPLGLGLGRKVRAEEERRAGAVGASRSEESTSSSSSRRVFPLAKPAVVEGRDSEGGKVQVTASVALPTQADYGVLINPGVAPAGSAWRIESFMVGDRPANPFDTSDEVYMRHSPSILVKGFTAGGKDSFRFVASTPAEVRSGSAPKEHNVSNIITIRLRRYRVEEYVSSPLSAVGRVSRRSGGGGSSDGPSSFHGGATVSGGRHVHTIGTSRTRDRFYPAKEVITFTLQLVGWQPVAETERDNRRAAIHAAGYDHLTMRLVRLDEQRDRLRRMRDRIIDRFPAARDIPRGELYDYDDAPPGADAAVSSEPRSSPSPSKHFIRVTE